MNLTMPDPKVLLRLAARAAERSVRQYRDLGPVSDAMHLDHLAYGYLRAAEQANGAKMNIWKELEKMEPELARLFSPRDDSPRLQTCGVGGCKNKVLGSRYCARCEEEINAPEYPFSRLILETDVARFLSAAWRRIWRKK